MSGSQTITLITGISRGIGKYLALNYLNEGHVVTGCSRGKPDYDLQGIRHFEVDITQENSVSEMFFKIKSEYRSLTNLINNAGIASMNHALLTPAATAQKIINTNYLGTFLCSREAAKLMRKNGGAIVNFTTVAVALDLEGEAIYASSKAAVESLTRVLAKEFSQFNVTVNAVGPTPVKTDLIANVPKDKIESLINRQAIKRFGEFTDLKNVI